MATANRDGVPIDETPNEPIERETELLEEILKQLKQIKGILGRIAKDKGAEGEG